MSGPLLDARCPRCGGAFECGAQAGECDCFELRLSDTLRQRLAAQFDGCLCLACLRQLAAEPPDEP